MGQAFAFVATCPTCGHAQLQNAFARPDLERLLTGGYPIEAYCTDCDEFWTVSIQKRVEIIEAVAITRAWAVIGTSQRPLRLFRKLRSRLENSTDS